MCVLSFEFFFFFFLTLIVVGLIFFFSATSALPCKYSRSVKHQGAFIETHSDVDWFCQEQSCPWRQIRAWQLSDHERDGVVLEPSAWDGVC